MRKEDKGRAQADEFGLFWMKPSTKLVSKRPNLIQFPFLLFLPLFFFLNFWLLWGFVALHGLSLVVVSGGYSSFRCVGFSPQWLLLWHRGLAAAALRPERRRASVFVAHRLSCSVACGIFPYQGSNPCPLHCQADSYPLYYQRNPSFFHF